MKRVRAPAFLAVVAAACTVLSVLALVLGPGGFTVGDVGRALWDPGDPNRVMIVELRLPRILVAVLAGAMLAISGTVMQAVFRNPLASPEVMGTASGAAFGALLAIAFGLAQRTLMAAPLCAFAGAVLVSWVVYALSNGAGGPSVLGLLLAGMALNTLVGALISFVAQLVVSDNYLASGVILTWLMGGLEARTLEHAATLAVALVAFGGAVLPYLREMDLLSLRDESAATLGVPVVAVRRILLLIACALTGVAVSITGGIAFVGLVVPHMTRLLVGPAHRALVPCAAALGALSVLLADFVCRIVFPGWELRLGMVTSLLGAPYFLYLLERHRRGAAL